MSGGDDVPLGLLYQFGSPVRHLQALRDFPRDIEFGCVYCENPDCCLAHLPWLNSGMAMKAPDWCGAHLCDRCHRYADGEAGRKDFQFRFEVLVKTLDRCFQHGVIAVEPRWKSKKV